MGHRKLHTSETNEMNPAQIWNSPHPDPRLYFENASIVAPSSDVAANGVNSMACLNNGLGLDSQPSSSLNVELPKRRAVSGTSHNAFLHPSSGSSSSQLPLQYAQPPCINLPAISDDGGRVIPPTGTHLPAHRRKAPVMPLVSDRGNSTGYHSAGSSSNHPMSSDHFWSESMPIPQFWPVSSSSLVPGYNSDSLSTAPEESQRNVRSRHNYILNSEILPPVSYMPFNIHPIHPIHPIASTPNLGISRQSSYAPESMASDRRIHSSDTSYAGSGVSIGTREFNGVYQPNLVQNGNPRAPITTLPVPPRSFSYRANTSYSAMGLASSSSQDRFSGLEPVASSRHSRPMSTSRHSGGRSGRARSTSSRSLLLDEDNAHSGWVHGGFMMIDQSAVYDIRNDQHSDLRLDVDSMSYEELLALGERMGSVSTGLSEDAIRRCLIEFMYQAHNSQQEPRCVICLEEYSDREMLGRLGCRHKFHVDCIKKWLSIKNACPICKAAAMPDTLEGKSKIFL